MSDLEIHVESITILKTSTKHRLICNYLPSPLTQKPEFPNSSSEGVAMPKARKGVQILAPPTTVFSPAMTKTTATVNPCPGRPFWKNPKTLPPFCYPVVAVFFYYCLLFYCYMRVSFYRVVQ